MKRLKEIKREIKALKLERELLRSKKEEHPLIIEAKKKGYKKGNFICFVGREEMFDDNCIDWTYEVVSDRVFTNPIGMGGACIYKNGKWAIIIK